MKENIEEKLWNYIDGTLNDQEHNFVYQLIQSDPQWKTKYNELMEVHQLMKNNLPLEEPSMRFTKNVMEEISRLYIVATRKTYINKNIVRGIALFFIVPIAGLLVFAFSQINWSEAGTANNMISDRLTDTDWTKVFSSTTINIFIIVNIILALMLMDMFLHKKRKEVNP